jgi:radical SAM superfamily enzyme YgiQ (UPF0313 family)
MLLQPASAGGNFEYVAIPRQGMLYLSSALAQWEGPFVYERDIWFEDRSGLIDLEKDLEGVDILMLTALINEAPRAYQVARQAKEFHPELITIGGGPQMSPLPEEAFDYGHFDVIVQREGEDIIGQLCDVLLEHRGSDRNQYLAKVPGISYQEDGNVVYTKRVGLVRPDFVELPDFRSIRDLTPSNPMAGAVMESIRGCTEKCTYCQVIQQFLGYRLVSRETEHKRLEQLHELAADGLIHTSRNGSFQVFISDDLHTPPLRAVKFRNERLERLKEWKGRTENMNLIIQARAEIGQDPELAHALQEANVKMLYLGVESDNAENLKAVNKRQEPGQMHQDLNYINELGFTVVAMTIIGLPYDTEKSIMELADWVTTVSRYQTANFLTPLPATSNWTDLQPLNEHGEFLQEGEMRPYQLYTGRQFVHHDERWSMQESREIFDKYTSKLQEVDDVYRRVFRILRTYKLRLAATSSELSNTLTARLGEATDTLNDLSDPASLSGRDFGENISGRVGELVETLRSVSQPLSNVRRDVADSIGTKLNELTESLKTLADPSVTSGKEVVANISRRITEVSDAIDVALSEQRTNGKKATEVG